MRRRLDLSGQDSVHVRLNVRNVEFFGSDSRKSVEFVSRVKENL
jgi:hypothetical protein